MSDLAVGIGKTIEAVVTVVTDMKQVGKAGVAPVIVVNFVFDVIVVVPKARWTIMPVIPDIALLAIVILVSGVVLLSSWVLVVAVITDIALIAGVNSVSGIVIAFHKAREAVVTVITDVALVKVVNLV